ncbi:hypothetical protein BDZ89DRAFT_1067392 [Hymenopellis radicata]|nr:hypothetical protein BDZ89DRAFT_1067392 [Hymenopellis radicata]
MDSAKPDVVMRSCEMRGARLRFALRVSVCIRRQATTSHSSLLERKRILELWPARCRSPRGKNVGEFLSIPAENLSVYGGTRSIASELDSESPNAPTDGGERGDEVPRDGQRCF